MRTRSQRLLSMVLALSMLLTFLPVSAFAEGTPPPYAVSNEDAPTLDENNTCTDNGNTYTYELNPTDNTATLSKFTGTGTTVKVPKTVKKDGASYTVTTIGKQTFANYRFQSALSSVTLPDSIQTIGDSAFYGCHLLSDITIPKDLITVESGAFSYCSNLTSITLPEGLTTIGSGAFGAAGLTNITLPKSLKNVGESAFTSDIKTVTYTGTQEQWNKLINSEDGNSFHKASNTPLTNVTPHCAHTVTFNKNGHGDPEEKVVQYDEKAKKPDDPKAEGFTFKGWYTASEGGTEFNFGTGITEDTELFAHWEEEQKKPDTEKPGTTTPENPGNTDKPTDKPNTEQKPDNNKPGTDKPNTDQTTPSQKPEQTTPPEAPAVEEDDTAAIGYAAAAVTAAFVGWGAYRIGSEVYLKYLLPKDVLLPQNRLQLAELLWEDAGRPAPADAAPYADVDADDTDARQAARWAVENGLLTLPNAEKPEEFAPYRSVSYAKSARAWNKAQQLKENAAAR